jgi:capsular exopolysaccharide synthesis family protein
VEIWQIVVRIVRGVRRRRKRLLVASSLLAFVVCLPAAYYLSKEPPRYKTSAVILLEARPDRVPIFQEFSPFRPLPVQLAILRSRSLAETVVETLPKASLQDLIENPYYVDWEQNLRNTYLRYRAREPEIESPQRRALKELQQARMTFELKSDGIVTISAEASKPQIAMDIVNTYIEALMSRTRSFNLDDARVTREFLEQQLADIKKSLSGSETSLRSFVSAHGGVKLPERSQAAVAQLSQSESALAEIESNRKMLQARLESLREKAEAQRRVAANAPAQSAPRTPSPEINRLRAQLTQLETTLLDLRMRYTDEHPRVRVVKDRIAEIQRQLGDAVKDAGPIVATPGAVPVSERVNFAEQVVAVEASYHSLVAQEEALRQQVQQLRKSLRGLSEGEMEYSRLNREVDSSRTLHTMLSDKLTAARIREQGEMKVVKVIDPASFPAPAPNQKRLKFLVAALGLAAVVGAGIPTATEWFHRRIESEEDVHAATELPVLAVIPRIRIGRPIFNGNQDVSSKRPSEHFILTEAFRSLSVSLQLMTRTERLRTLLVTSPLAHEGKSTVVVNLGLALSEAGKRVVLADTDFHRPTLHRTLKVAPGGGLMHAMRSDDTPAQEALTHVGDGMWLAPRGDSPQATPRALLSGTRLGDLVSEMATKADLVVCDSSPVLLVPENLFLVGAVDSVILVARAGHTSCRDLARAKILLEQAGARILGVIINDMPASALKGYYSQAYTAYARKGIK